MDIKSFLITALSGKCARTLNDSVRAVMGRGGLRIINLHRVLDNEICKTDYRYLGDSPLVDEFDRMIGYLTENFNTISIKDYIQNCNSIDPGKLFVALTFDDGYLDNYTNALPVLRKYNMPATIFVSIDALDGKPLWFQSIYCAIDKCEKVNIINPCTNEAISLNNKWQAMQVASKSMLKIPVTDYSDKIQQLYENCGVMFARKICESEKMMTWDVVKSLKDESLIDIGSHTITHFSLLSLSDDRMKYELQDSYDKLKSALGCTRVHLAYPNGMYDENVMAFVKEAGYEAAFTMERGRNNKHSDLFQMKREYIFNNPHRIGFQLDDWDLRLKKIFA